MSAAYSSVVLCEPFLRVRMARSAVAIEAKRVLRSALA